MSRSMLSRLFSWFRPASLPEVKDTGENERLEASAHVDDDWYRFMILDTNHTATAWKIFSGSIESISIPSMILFSGCSQIAQRPR